MGAEALLALQLQWVLSYTDKSGTCNPCQGRPVLVPESAACIEAVVPWCSVQVGTLAPSTTSWLQAAMQAVTP